MEVELFEIAAKGTGQTLTALATRTGQQSTTFCEAIFVRQFHHHTWWVGLPPALLAELDEFDFHEQHDLFT